MSECGAFKVELSNCEREPIHVLGNIQSFGFLLTAGADWLVRRVSVNVEQFIGLKPDAIADQPLTAILSEKALHAIRNRVTLLRGPDGLERMFKLMDGGNLFDVA